MSTFIYWPAATDRQLTYLAAEVIALGSSQIELRAAGNLANRMEILFRDCKEGAGKAAPITVDPVSEVKRVCADLQEELSAAVARCAGLARGKLVRENQRHALPRQWRDLKVLIGGGGSALAMYPAAVRKSFSTWFTQPPPTSPLPLPADFDWPANVRDRDALFRRITVAYGLSFDFPTLAQCRLPAEVEPLPESEEQEKVRDHAPSKDEV